MPTTYKCLGQIAPSATTETDLYTVPSATSAILSSVAICNRGVDGTVRLAHSVGGGATANKDYIYYDVAIPAGETLVFTGGICMATTDKLKGYASHANFSFSVWGQENT